MGDLPIEDLTKEGVLAMSQSELFLWAEAVLTTEKAAAAKKYLLNYIDLRDNQTTIKLN